METLSFAFGVLSMIGLLFVIVIVIGAVKVIKQEKQIKELNHDLSDNMRGVWQTMDRRFEEIHQRIDDVHRTIDRNYSESKSYTDSRLDKLDQKLTGTTDTKQTLKG
jgi:hypothetical protein